jgi:hypothetical protein
VLFNRDYSRLGSTEHGKAQLDFPRPFAPIFKVLLQLLRILVSDNFVRMTDPELLQAPWHTIPSMLRSAEPAEAMETFNSKIMERVSEDIVLPERQAAVGLKSSLSVFSPFFGIFHAARRLKYGPKICPANRSDCKEIEPSDLACVSGLSGVDSRFNRTTCSGTQPGRIISAIRLPAIENRRASFRVFRGIRDNRAWHSFACGKCFAVSADVLHRAGLRDIRKVVGRGGAGSLGFAFVEPPKDHFSGSGLVD